LIGVGVAVVLQLDFTYMPSMQGLFPTRSIEITEGAIVIAIDHAILIILDIEKRVRLSLPPSIVRSRKLAR